MFSHIVVGSSDLQRSKTFYDALFAAIGGPEGMNAGTRVIYAHNGGRFMVATPVNGEPCSFANGGTIGFLMASAEQADAWHAAGIAAGGKTCEDPPGVRELGVSKLYLAYLRDPDGNKLCANYRIES